MPGGGTSQKGETIAMPNPPAAVGMRLSQVVRLCRARDGNKSALATKVLAGGALPHIKIAGSRSADCSRKPGKRRTAVLLAGVAGFCAIGYALAACSAAHYGMTRCPRPKLVGNAARAGHLELLPGSAPRAPGSATATDWTCTYVPADQYQRWLRGAHHALSVEIYLFPKKVASKRLLGTVDGHAAMRRGAARLSGNITLAGNQTPVALFKSGYGAWTGERLPDGSYALLAIYLSSGQAPRTAAEFQNELQAMARVSGLG